MNFFLLLFIRRCRSNDYEVNDCKHCVCLSHCEVFSDNANVRIDFARGWFEDLDQACDDRSVICNIHIHRECIGKV